MHVSLCPPVQYFVEYFIWTNEASGNQCLDLLVDLTLRKCLFEVCIEFALVVLRQRVLICLEFIDW